MNPVRVEYISKVDQKKDWYMYHDAGPGSTCLVYIHGHGSHGDQIFTREDIKCNLPMIEQHQLSIFSPNLRDNAWMGPAAAQDLFDMLTELKAKFQWKRFIFLSGSMGATSVLIFAVLHPELVDAAGLLGAASDVKGYREYCLNHPEWKVLLDIAAAISENYPEEGDMEKHSARLHADKLTMPIRYYHGEDDVVMPVSEMLSLKELLKDHPDAVFKVIPGGNHDSPIKYFGEILLSLL